MESKTLVQVVSKIEGRKVNETYAKIFALNSFGELSAYIRNEHNQNIIAERIKNQKKVNHEKIRQN